MYCRFSWLLRLKRFVIALVIVLSMGESVVLAAQVAVLNDTLPGMDVKTTEAVAAALRREGMEVSFISAEEACDKAVLSAKKYFLYVITSPRCYPANGSAALSDYLQGGGHMLVLGNPTQNSVFKYKDQWISKSDIQRLINEQKAKQMVCDFEGESSTGQWTPFGWHGRSFKPEWSTIEQVESAIDGSAKCAKVTVDYDESAWNSTGMTVKLAPEESAGTNMLLTFWAKGDAHTKRLGVRLRLGNSNRGIAVVSLTEKWQRYGLCTNDFWLKGEKTDPAIATEVRFVLHNSRVIPLNRSGKRTFWIDQVGLATNPFSSFGNLDAAPMPIIETISPHHKRYPLKDIVSVKVLGPCGVWSDKWRVTSGECKGNAGTQGGTTVGPAVTQSVVSGCRTHVAPSSALRATEDKSRLSSGTTCSANNQFPVPVSASSCYPRPEGKGFGHGYKWRWIPLAQACDKDGAVRGTAAWMTLHREPLNEGPDFEDAVRCLINGRDMPKALPFTGSVCAVCAVSDHKTLQKIAKTSLLGDMVKRMQEGVFLSHAGSEKFSYWPGEAIKLGAVALNEAQKTAVVKVRIQVREIEADKIVSENSGAMIIKPGALSTVSFNWTPEELNIGSYTVTTELLRDGKTIDTISHEFGVLDDSKPDPDEFVTTRGRNFWLKGEPWYPVGVNYWPRYAIALECEDYTYHWLTPGFYNPEEVERDLAQMEKMGFNFIAIRAHHQTDRRTVLDVLRRCKKHGIRAFLFVHSNEITDEPHYFQGIMMPTAFNEKATAEYIRECRLSDNPTLLGYDLIWEPAGWLFGGFTRGSFGWHGTAPYRDRWNKAWTQWIIDRYGSFENAEADWGMPVPKKGDLATYPSGKQFSEDGPWRVMMAAYRRFMEDFTSREFNDTAAKIRSADPNHLISFRQGNLSPLDFTITPMTKHLDFFTMEGYSFNTSGTGPDAVGFINRYIDFVTNRKPYFWCEYGMNVWDHEERGPSQDKIDQLSAIYEMIGDIGFQTGSSGVAPWWWSGGYRVSERSDYGVLKRDGSPRSCGLSLQESAAKYKVPRGYPESDTWFEMDRDSHAGALRWIAFNTGAEAYKKARSDNKMLGIKTKGSGTTSADTPLVAVGNRPYNGKNPPKYLNAEFNRVRIKVGNGAWKEVANGARISVPKGKPVIASVSVGNLQEATWLTTEECGNRPGAVYLASTDESQLKLKQPITKKTAYFDDFDFGEKLILSEGISTETKVVLQMSVDGRIWFGEKWRFSLLPVD